MFNNYRKGPALFAIAAFSIMMGCQKEEEPLDLELPGVTLEVSGNLAKLYNEVTLTSTATDNGTIERVVFYANSDSIGQATTEPYELTWNTKEVEDGPYVLKAVAYDASGNKSEAAKEVTIKNTLFVMHIEEGSLKINGNVKQREWVFLSDKNGHTVGEPKEAFNGANLHWERPLEFYADTIYLNRINSFTITYEGSERTYENTTFITYTDFTLEEAVVKARVLPEAVGEVNISVENDFDGSAYYEYITSFPFFGVSSATNQKSVSFPVTMHKSSQKGFSTYENVPPQTEQHLRKKYGRLDELEVGNSYSFHTNDYVAMQGQMVFFPFDISRVSISTEGYLDAEQEKGYTIDRFSAWDNPPQELKTFYTDAFPYIHTTISGVTGNQSFYLGTMAKAPDVYSLPEFSLSVATKEKDIEVATQGSFDIGYTFSDYQEDNGTNQVVVKRITYFGSDSDVRYVLPEIPVSLIELFPSLSKPLEHNSDWAMDNKGLVSYEDMLKYWFTDTFSGFEYREYSSLRIYPENTGGRILSFQQGEDQKGVIEKEEFHARGMLSY